MIWYLPYSENTNKEVGIPLQYPWLISSEFVEGYTQITEENFEVLLNSLNSSLSLEQKVEIVSNGGTPSNPDFTYSGGNLIRVDYSDGSFKELTYVSGNLTRVDFNSSGTIKRKDLIYVSGILTEINESVV